ncbi:MAG: zf-TFIIB domain-containing protein [Rhodoferax sp.]
MKCPICPDATLLMSDRQGVEIDYCPQCRGIWLDRGELDKLLELAAKPTQSTASYSYPAHATPPSRADFMDSDHHGMQGHPYKRKKSWLSDIFD